MKIIRRVSIVLFLAVCFVSAAQQGDLDRQNEAIRRARAHLAEIEKLTSSNEGEMLRSQQGLKLVRNGIIAKREIVRSLNAEIRNVEARIAADTKQTEALEGRLTELKEQYGEFVYAAWKNHKMTSATAFLLAARDFNDAMRRISHLRRYNRMRVVQGAEIDSLGRTLRAEIDSLNDKKARLGTLKAESDAVIASLAGDQQRYEAAQRALGADRKKLEADAKRERDAIAAAQREIDRIIARQAEASMGALTEAEIALSDRFEENKGLLPWPVGSSGTVVDHFGIERMADGIELKSSGIVVAAQSGSGVRAIFDGRVTGVYSIGQFGRCITVRSGDYIVLYGNLAETGLRNGDAVALNQTLGTLGGGVQGGPSLLFQIWLGKTPLDPEEWLRK